MEASPRTKRKLEQTGVITSGRFRSKTYANWPSLLCASQIRDGSVIHACRWRDIRDGSEAGQCLWRQPARAGHFVATMETNGISAAFRGESARFWSAGKE
jgi:hypothetical protein